MLLTTASVLKSLKKEVIEVGAVDGVGKAFTA
jgi:hypothetical protein